MKQKYTDETFLARWVENDLSANELEEFQNSDSYQEFKKINEASLLLIAPNYNKTIIYNKTITKIAHKNKPSKVIKLSNTWVYIAIAMVFLVISIFYFNNSSTSNFSTKYSEQLVVKLPDNSIAHLYPESKLTFNKNSWSENRQVFLTGEAYFDVEKGKTFTVMTSLGNVIVVGTKFTVNSSNNFFQVKCFQGKVKAISNNNVALLSKGKAFRRYNNINENWIFKEEKPSWISGESNFNNAPLSTVILKLEKQYNLKFDTSKIDINKRFTGTFTYKDINIALRTVFAPMKIYFKLAKNSSVILLYNE